MVEGGVSQALARRLYCALMALLTPLYVARLWWRGRREPGYRVAIGERFGRYRAPAPAPGLLWIHAVSLGETHAAAALVAALRQQRPGVRLLLTHGTATGRAAGRALLAPGDAQAWLPWDAPGPVARFLRHWQPSAGVLMETEIWPTLLHGAAAAGVPVWLASARLSARSLRRGQRAALLLRPAMRALAGALAQSDADAARLRVAGAARVEVVGNLKYDVTPDPALLARGAAWALRAGDRPLVLALSTRDGEERMLLQAWSQAPRHARARLWLVPRHPQRFDEVAALVEGQGLSLSRRSGWPADGPDAPARAADVWLGDTLGEMPAYCSAARLALLGGSFAPLGGQNLIEAAACGCPVLMGPHTFNFADAAERLLAAGGGERVADAAAAVDRALALLDDAPTLAAMRERAAQFAAAHRGAAARMAAAILAGPPAG